MAIEVTSAVLDALLAEARAAHPRECCGLLFGTDSAVTEHRPAANIHPTPATHFEIDPQALVDAHRAMRGGGARLVGYYHSHPAGPPRPSATDRALAAADGMIWAIAGEGRVELWRAGEGGMVPLPYRRAAA
ncbi:MAG: M67 family metallopeptidase [Altererythrobacter sp.]|nr:M67 family metallopeptidase [Altererythrobacter sp.]